MQLEDGQESVRLLLKNGVQFDGLFSSSDYAAMGAIQVLKEKGISIPDQVAVAGFNGRTICRILGATTFIGKAISNRYGQGRRTAVL